jgi:hypothetical protein
MTKQSSVIVVVLVALAAAILSACASSTAPTPSANSNAPVVAAATAVPTVAPSMTPAPPTPEPTAAPTSASLLDAFTKAQAALTNAKTIELKISSTSNGKTATAVFDYVKPDAYHMTQSTGMELIAIKDKGAYEKKDGKWTKLPIPAAALDTIISNANPLAIVDKERQQISAKLTPQIGADLLDGKPMVTYTYNGTISLASNMTIVGSVEFWYGVTDGWLYQWKGSDTKGDQGTATIAYNTPISIVAPIP